MASDTDKKEPDDIKEKGNKGSMSIQKGESSNKEVTGKEKKREKKERKKTDDTKKQHVTSVKTRNPESRVKRHRSASVEIEVDKRQQKEVTSPASRKQPAPVKTKRTRSEESNRSPVRKPTSDSEAAAEEAKEDCSGVSGKAKRRITPQVLSINNWTIPRRRFQPVVKLQEGGGLKMLPLDETDTLDLLDSTSGEDSHQKYISSYQQKPPLPPHKPTVQNTTVPDSDSNVFKEPPPPPVLDVEHLKVLAGVPAADIPPELRPLHQRIKETLHEISHPPPPMLVVNPVLTKERNLLSLIEQSLIRSTTMLRRRQRKDAALQHIALGDSGSEGTDGSRIQILKDEIKGMEDRRKNLEHVINTRVNAHPRVAAPVATNPDEWDEPEYVQDAADRLELSCLRKELSEKLKVLDSVEAERAATTRTMRILSIEDKSAFGKFPILNDRYLVLTLLGCGGFSEVWKAFDRIEARMVAVKIHQLCDRWSEEQKESYLKRTQREYDIQRDIIHENVVRVHECFSINDSSFACVMEFTPDEDLSSHLCRHKTIREREAKLIIKQVLLALQHITDPKRKSELSGDRDASKVIHFDLKPGNILFFGHLTVRITDFGLSKNMAPGNKDMELTSQGAGTFWYLPPECFGTGVTNRISPKVDIWSAGIIFYQMLFGKRPFGHDLPGLSVLMEGTICKESIESLEFPAQPKVTKASIDIIKKMLSYDPDDRPDIDSLLSEFDDSHDDDGDHVVDESAAPPANILTKRSRKVPNNTPAPT
eukprot:TRINITY_DN8729_c4_g1_i1.p1 TRINITY_DN8729_c4_g1~~TRINITY_DN8729_c4_g1_i1.p1  ORF type:complete len:763 (+),score=146.52 TRINITY_DN8729_c4_g1_i1:36-2324(+)